MKEFEDLTNRKFGRWTVINFIGNNKNVGSHKRRWLCRCICGLQREVAERGLLRGKSNGCGFGCPYAQNYDNLLGKKFGRWSPMCYAGNKSWLCRCECGNLRIVFSNTMTSGTSKSCGCYCIEKVKERFTTHGLHDSPEYHAWRSMHERCFNENNPGYKRYGERGIRVCDRWLESFENFYEDMGDRPSRNHSIDRIDNNGNYEKENCRWATRLEQAHNMSSNVVLEYNGEKLCLSEWARKLNIDQATLSQRLKKMSIEEAFTKPIEGKRMITYNGETLCLTDWANKLNINLGTLWCRLNKMSVEDAFNK